jgi:mannose-1-phosphate guanylyltransferase
MKAVVLAGGMGTRLRPLTYSTPKALVPIAGKPLISRIIESLPPSVDTVVLAVSYMRDVMEDHFAANPCGRKLVLVNETSPMGTGGALKNASQYIDETFVALNGDCVSSLNIKGMVKQHREKGGIGTIALWQVEDPSAYGVALLDPADRVVDFQEKPKREEARSNLINAGVYVFEPEILDYIGKGIVSLEREVFPSVLEDGLFGHRFEGFWVDCGTRENVLKAQGIYLQAEGQRIIASKVSEKATITPPNLLSSCTVGFCKIGPYVCLEQCVQVVDGAEVTNSLLMRGAIIEKDALVRNSIIGPGKKVDAGERVEDGILADH